MAKIKKRAPITKGTTKTLPGPALIRKFHKLQAQLQAAKTAQDDKAITSVQAEIDELGGIEQYQKASIKGQDKRRGGDSSKQLVEWLKADSSLLQTGKTKVLTTRVAYLIQHHGIAPEEMMCALVAISVRAS